MKNPYKRLDIFRCKYDSHAKFDYKVSTYHVLRIKNCYPHGCLSFKWKCNLLDKGKSCHKGYQFVGKKCFGCKHYYDEKINHHPELLISENEYHEFLDELEEFEDWLESIQGKDIDFWGVIDTVKPRLTKVINKDESVVHLEGYILHFKEAYLDQIHWEDPCYAIIYADQQQRHRFAAGDDLEFKCRVEIDRGRLIFKKIRATEFRQKSNQQAWTNSQALVAKGTATLFENQLAKCLHCEKGVLVDVTDKTNSHWERKRELYCLAAFPSPDVCFYHIKDLLDEIEAECP